MTDQGDPAASVRPATALAWSRYLAVLFAVGLGIGEAVINWGRWQYAPLWIIDYVIVVWLLWAVVSTRAGQRIYLLLAAWAFTSGVFYMALFSTLDPELGPVVNPVLLSLVGVMLAASVTGFFLALLTIHAHVATARRYASGAGELRVSRPNKN